MNFKTYYSIFHNVNNFNLIFRENLSLNRWKWWMKAIFVNVISLGALFFFTTPLLFVHTLHESGYIRAVKSDVSISSKNINY